MASLPTQSFATIVANTIAGIQGRASKLLNFSTGSTLRAIVEGFAGLFLWFQAMALQVLQASRLSTSSGTDVDTFTADFMPIIPGSATTSLPSGSPRLGAQAASGQVTLSRFTSSLATLVIPVGSTVQTSDGSQSFAVIADPTYPTFVPGTPGSYSLPSAILSVVVPVVAVVPGAAGNVAAATITRITSPITGVDLVTNTAAFTNGADFESDSALKKRFSDYILGLSRGDNFGLSAAIEGVDVDVQWTLTEDYNYDGSYRPGYFLVVADDGSGNPSPAFITSVLNAANAVRPLGIQCQVFLPVIITANVAMQIGTSADVDHNTVLAIVKATLATNINSLGLGNPLPWSLLASWAYSVPGVTSVSAVFLRGFSGDAASVNAYRLTSDGKSKIYYATIKAGVITLS